VALIGLTGCQSGPKYQDESKEDLRLTQDDFPSNWKEYPDINDEMIVWGSNDETKFVAFTIEIYDTIEETKNQYEEIEMGYTDTNEYVVGQQSFWTVTPDGLATVVFRDSNAIAQLAGVKQSGADTSPATTLAQRYAEKMHENW
jgi:hypothetical protein